VAVAEPVGLFSRQMECLHTVGCQWHFHWGWNAFALRDVLLNFCPNLRWPHIRRRRARLVKLTKIFDIEQGKVCCPKNQYDGLLGQFSGRSFLCVVFSAYLHPLPQADAPRRNVKNQDRDQLSVTWVGQEMIKDEELKSSNKGS
jgi:hypothetical protein